MSNDSDDFFVKGEEAEQKVLNEVKIWYEITSPANPTEVQLKIKTKDGRKVINLTADLPKIGVSHFTWDGKNDKGEFVEDWFLTTQIEAYFTTPDPVKSNLHHLTELSGKHKPKIFLHEDEYCNPMYFDEMETICLYLVDYFLWIFPIKYIEGNSAELKILQLIEGWPGATENHYINFANDLPQKNCPPNMPKMVFSRGKVQDNLVFVQYWMFYPSSTMPTSDPDDTDAFHEGDWEMMQVVVTLDTTNKVLSPTGATASQHYGGQTLLWPDIQISDKNKPIIYIAGGSHATYFSEDDFRTTGLPIIGRYLFRDYTFPAKERSEQYTLQPFEPFGVAPSWWLWGGRWGDYSRNNALPQRSSGPPSPKYTEREGIRIFDDPKTFYESN